MYVFTIRVFVRQVYSILLPQFVKIKTWFKVTQPILNSQDNLFKSVEVNEAQGIVLKKNFWELLFSFSCVIT